MLRSYLLWKAAQLRSSVSSHSKQGKYSERHEPEDGCRMKLQLTYDKEADAFAISRGRVIPEHAEMWEVFPWAMLEVGEESGNLLCVEILGADKILGDLLKPLKSKEKFVRVSIEGDLSPIKNALLNPDNEAEEGYKEFIMFRLGEEQARNTRLDQVRAALAPYLHSIHESNSARPKST